MAKKHIVVGRDADTEAKAKTMTEEIFGADNVVRGHKTNHKPGCSIPDDPIIGVDRCNCPRVTVFSDARKLV
jgi:hypothetical protein